MNSKTDEKQIMINKKAFEFIEEIFQSVLSRCQIGLNHSIKDSEFVFDRLLYYRCDRTNPNCSGSYIEFADCIKNKKATINPQ